MRLYYILIFTLLRLTFTNCQQLYFDHFTIESGLANNQVFDIEQDELGYIWFGTLNGLNRYNGYTFDTYMPSGTKEGHIKGNIIRTICKGKNGNIWAVTGNGGLNFYNAKDEKFYSFPDSVFPFNQAGIHNIIEDKYGRIRFVAFERYYVFNPNSYQLEHLFENRKITKQLEYSDDTLWLIERDGILFYDTHHEKIIKPHPSLSNLVNVVSISRDAFSGIYILTFRGIYHFDQEYSSLKLLIDFNDFPGYFYNRENLTQLQYDGKSFWVRIRGKVIRIDKTKLKPEVKPLVNVPYNKTAFHGTSVRDIFVDNGQNTWIATDRSGLNLLNCRKNQFKHYYPYDFNTNTENLNPVRAICETKNGDIWVGFEVSGLGYYSTSDNKYHSYNLNGKSIGAVRVIFEDSGNNIWIGTALGVYVIEHRTGKLQSLRNWIQIRRIYTIKEDIYGQIWIGGTKLGIANLNNRSIRFIKLENLSSAIRDLHFENNTLWIASDGNGVFHYDLTEEKLIKQISSDSPSTTICDNKVYSICVQDTNVWAGTNSGLSKINKANYQVTNYYVQDGLSNNIVYGLYSDSNDNLWISTARGISYYKVATGKFKKYLLNRFFMDDASFQAQDHKIFFGGYDGLISFMPEQILQVQVDQKPVLKNMQLFGEKVKVHEKSILKQSLTCTQDITLDYTQNTFSFTFNSFPVTTAGLTAYKYKLEGYQSGWVVKDQDNTAEFTQVPPGEYELKVLCSNADGVWSTNILKLKITITPPFWLTKWFMATVIVLIAILLFILIKARENNIKQRNILLEKEVDKKTTELRNQNKEIIKQKDEIKKMSEQVHQADLAKLSFFTNVSHEFKTPLTLIIGHLEMIKQSDKTNLKSAIQMIRRNAVKLLELVNDIVDFRKASQGELQLNIEEWNCVEIIKEIFNDFKAAAALKKIHLQFTFDKEEIFLYVDRKKFEKIINNLISNALKYTPENGTVDIIIEESHKTVKIYVRDTGIGIEETEQDKIFNRFYRSRSANHGIGHGIGLSLVKLLVELHKGTISVESAVEKGSCFMVELLKGKEHLPSESFVKSGLSESLKFDKSELTEVPLKSDIELAKGGVPSLLIVEDNHDLLNFMCDLLTDLYTIHAATNGIEAMQWLEDNQPDLIISDIMMPKMDGISLCKELKQDIRFSHIPLILLTAKSDIETRIEGFELGIDDYIDKPFEPRLLKVRIASLLANRELLKRELKKGSLVKLNDKSLLATDKLFLEKVWRFMEENYHNEGLSVDDFGKEIGMSRATFFRKFKGLTGQSPIDFIITYRMQKAGDLMKLGNTSISEICTKVGYRSTSQFRKTFKEEFNMSPTEYIKVFRK